MERRAGIGLALFGIVVVAGIAYSRQSRASTPGYTYVPQSPDGGYGDDYGFTLPFFDTPTQDEYIPSTPVSEPGEPIPQVQQDEPWGINQTMTDSSGNVPAFLAMLREFESRNQYNVLYGGGTFTDMSRHPFVRDGKCDFTNAPRINVGLYAGQVSTAAGAYQINCATFIDASRALRLYDFSPQTQDTMATWLLQKSGAIAAIVQGNIAYAITLASKRWASLPGSIAGQNPQNMQTALATYQSFIA